MEAWPSSVLILQLNLGHQMEFSKELPLSLIAGFESSPIWSNGTPQDHAGSHVQNEKLLADRSMLLGHTMAVEIFLSPTTFAESQIEKGAFRTDNQVIDWLRHD